MNTITITWTSLLVACVALWPEESQFAVNFMTAKLQLIYMNWKLRTSAWLMYRRLKKDFAELGLDIGPFKYVPLEERDR